MHVHVLDRGLRREEAGDVADRLQLDLVGRPLDPRLEHLHLVGGRRIAHRGPHEEAVELRLGQRISAFRLDRVLRGDDEERAGQRPARAIGCDLTLLHRLEEG